MAEPYYKQHWVDIDSDRHSAYDKILAYHPAMEPLLRPLDLKAGLRVLDVGSGPGHTTFELARARQSWRRSSCTMLFLRSRFPTLRSIECGAKMFLSMSTPPPILSRKWRA